MRQKGVSYAKYGYFFSIPFITAFLIFSLYPIVYTIIISFTDLLGAGKTLNILRSSESNFFPNEEGNGIDLFGNFVSVLGNTSFRNSVGNTAIIWFMNFIPQILLALLFAAWFTSKRIEIKKQGAFKVLFYMPNIITAATIAILFDVLFSRTGVVNYILQAFGRPEPFEFILYKWPVRMIIAFIQFWMWYGYTMLILISGILGLNPELFEAAEIDGASSSQTFFQITLPNLRTIMVYTLITSMIGGLQMFDIPWLFNSGNPSDTSQTITMFIYRQAYMGRQFMARGAAASLILFILIAILAAGVFYMMRDKHEIAEKKKIKAAREGRA